MSGPRSRRPHRKCEICYLKEKDCRERLLFAKFPLKDHVCKEWVKVTGKEDLAFLPIEKLHELRYVCGNHFKKRDFTKSKTRLKKHAIPSLNLRLDPLPDELLKDFPMHVFKSEENINLQTDHSYTRKRHYDHTYCQPEPLKVNVSLHRFPMHEKRLERFKMWVHSAGGKLETKDDYQYYQKQRICDRHFTERDRNRNNRLNELAVPTLHLIGNKENILNSPA